MEELQKAFYTLVGPRFGGILGAFVLVLVLIPYIYRAWETWLDARSGKRFRELERGRYELLKIRYEIEAIRKQHELPEFRDQPPSEKQSSLSPPVPAKPSNPRTFDQPKPQVETLKPRTRPTIVLMLVLVLFSILAVAALFGAFIALLGGILISHDYGTGSAMLAFSLAILFGTFVGIRRISRQLPGRRNKAPVEQERGKSF
jgi:nitrate reductase NapE component